MFWGPRPARLCRAGRRYAAGLAGLLGPAAAFGGLGLACGPPSAALGLRRLRRLLDLASFCPGPKKELCKRQSLLF
ncbi:hypothetical protein SGRA_0069 [Saprospira grandis str. Lewin]|uniref:Uncharacterized protein n=1 Tax=Saprospira grandis (strain Lewin) TaxID=984262 RepID=H6L4D5_SAPGL|nr:hypothetical protein SGRA_0069 [Saprospira grandis str. Lewin]